MNKAYFLMKAQKARPDLISNPDEWEWSVKLDGIRAFWDGGITRGRNDAPWAPGVLSTGLWTINGKAILAPSWWLDSIPLFPIDGELWAGPGNFQYVSSVVRRTKNILGDEWGKIMLIHHSPISYETFCTKRLINEPHCKTICTNWLDYIRECLSTAPARIAPSGLHYEPLEWHNVKSFSHLQDEVLPTLVDAGHEGVMLRRKSSLWEPVRSWNLLKLKPFHDDEAYVIGVKAGTGRLEGMVGSLTMRWHKDIVFNMGALYDHERALDSIDTTIDPVIVAKDMAGKDLPATIYSRTFPTGTKLTFKYRELTNDGVPKDPRIWRKSSC